MRPTSSARRANFGGRKKHPTCRPRRPVGQPKIGLRNSSSGLTTPAASRPFEEYFQCSIEAGLTEALNRVPTEPADTGPNSAPPATGGGLIDQAKAASTHTGEVHRICDLEWSQVEFGRSAALHVRRVKNGKPSVHPLRGDEIRALRELRRQFPDTGYVFATERGGPFHVGRC